MTREHSPFFYTEPSLIQGLEAVLEGSSARHLEVVRRAKAGDRIHVCDGAGRVLDVRLTDISKTRARGTILAEETLQPPSLDVTVFQGLAKGGKVDFVIEKLVEIGVTSIVVFGAGRSVPRWDEPRAARAADRWRTIAYEAAKQSRRAFLPAVAGPVGPEAAAEMAGGLVLIAHGSAPQLLGEVLPENRPERISLVVGPEGGLEMRELEVFQAVGGATFTLGPQVLRTETAALVAASLVLHRYGLLG